MENNDIDNQNVQISVHPKWKQDLCTQFGTMVKTLVEQRHSADFTQQFMADWCGVDRRKIMALESGELFDIELLFNYADKFADLGFVIELKNT